MQVENKNHTCGMFLFDKKLSDQAAVLLKELGFELFSYSTSNEAELTDIILRKQPSLILLDIDSICLKNIQVELQSCLSKIPDIIALSINTEQTYNCIKLGVLDYLLKPAFLFDLRKALMKYKKSGERRAHICFKNYSDYYFLEPEKVIFLQADNNTTDIMLTSGKTITAFKSLKVFEANLPEHFYRIHNSYIINSNKILRINFGKNKVYLGNDLGNSCIPFSKTYKAKLEEIKYFLAAQDIIS